MRGQGSSAERPGGLHTSGPSNAESSGHRESSLAKNGVITRAHMTMASPRLRTGVVLRDVSEELCVGGLTGLQPVARCLVALPTARTVSLCSPVDVGSAFLSDGGLALVLAQRARDKRRPLVLEFPGGKVEPGEEPARAAEREFFEETGSKIRTLFRITTLDRDHLTHVFFGVLPHGIPLPASAEHSMIAIVKINHVFEFTLSESTVTVLRHLVALARHARHEAGLSRSKAHG